LFSPIAASMVEAFCSRADNVYKWEDCDRNQQDD
jgi:ribosome-associated toxin RatA of RatAB toxin-antitoxin module